MEKIYSELIKFVGERLDTIGFTFFALAKKGFIANQCSDYAKIIIAFEMANFEGKQNKVIGYD